MVDVKGQQNEEEGRKNCIPSLTEDHIAETLALLYFQRVTPLSLSPLGSMARCVMYVRCENSTAGDTHTGLCIVYSDEFAQRNKLSEEE